MNKAAISSQMSIIYVNIPSSESNSLKSTTMKLFSSMSVWKKNNTYICNMKDIKYQYFWRNHEALIFHFEDFFSVNNAPLPKWWKNWCNSDQWSSYPFICCTPTGEVFLKHLDFVDNRWLITVHYNYWKKMFIHLMLFRKLYHKNQACLQSSSRC